MQNRDVFVRMGDEFVKVLTTLPIQYNSCIELTDKELRTGKITLKRIRELENLLNSEK